MIEKKEISTDLDESKRIKNVLLGKDDKICNNLSLQLKRLIEKLELNQEIIIDETKINETKTADSEFFYISWINSFNTEQFKSHQTFKDYIKRDKISSLANMGFYLNKILDGFYIDIYVDDPSLQQK